MCMLRSITTDVRKVPLLFVKLSLVTEIFDSV
jgi:hypothetical protein